MPTIKDSNNVVLFSDPVKLYLFKDDKTVKIAFKITDYVVTNREIHQTDFEHILENWNISDGVQGLEMKHDGKIWWYASKFGPRPECIDANMVCINFGRFNFRISEQEMQRISDNYYHQKSNKMHWDTESEKQAIDRKHELAKLIRSKEEGTL
jgi:hypothetical protein